MLPLLVAMLLAGIGFSQTYTNRGIMVHAAEVGAYKGATSRSALACVSATKVAASGLKIANLTVTCTASPSWTAGADVTVIVGYPWAISFLLYTKTGTTHYTTHDIVR